MIKNIRFCDNNFAELITSQIDYSSQLASFPFSNAINKFRSKVWKPSGCFVITTSNSKLYINDGTDKTVTLTAAKYTTPALLASHIQTKLNAASSNWTVTYNSIAGTYRFKISNTGSVSLRFSQTTDAVWNTIGYTYSTDQTGTDFTANEQRNHTSEYAIFDMGYQAQMLFFAVIGPLQSEFPISSSATIKLYANNLNEWSAPPFELNLTRLDGGIFQFMDAIADTRYRYWKFEIVDKLNPLGPEGLSIGHIFIGDYITLTTRNTNRGFTKSQIDPAQVFESENGALYFDEKTKYTNFDSMAMSYLDKNDKDTMEGLFRRLGKTTPLYVSIDPTKEITNDIDELTKYVVFNESPKFQHIIYDKFTMSLSFREVL